MRKQPHIARMLHVEPDQTAYIKDRNSTRLIQDMLDYIENSSEEGILFTVDIEKALTQLTMISCLRF